MMIMPLPPPAPAHEHLRDGSGSEFEVFDEGFRGSATPRAERAYRATKEHVYRLATLAIAVWVLACVLAVWVTLELARTELISTSPRSRRPASGTPNRARQGGVRVRILQVRRPRLFE